MAVRWSYSTDELTLALDLARADADAWLNLVADDERRGSSQNLDDAELTADVSGAQG